MNDGRMTSRVSIRLYGPGGMESDHSEECTDEDCQSCPQKEVEDNG